MKLSMAQMRMTENMEQNSEKAQWFCREAAGSNLLFYPEIQATPFFPQYPGRDASGLQTPGDAPVISSLKNLAREQNMDISPNFYMDGYDRSLWITPKGEVEGSASMVHIYQGEKFYEQDYYKPSEDGFQTFDTPYGRVGIVICFDRHIPESIRTCALKGADLVIIPTANTEEEPMELFEWEIRVQAMQNAVFVAMCNRVGREDAMDFAGQSLVADPYGNLVVKAGNEEGLISAELDLSLARKRKKEVPWLDLRRTDLYL